MNTAEEQEKEYQTLTQEEFDKLCEKHLEWLKLPEDQKDHEATRMYGPHQLKLPKYDLTNLNLKGKTFIRASFQGSIFSGMDLRSTNFKNCLLQLANFDGADLSRADLSNAFLDGTSLQNTTLKNAILINARFIRHNITLQSISANLNKADLTGADLTDTNFDGAILTEAIFHDTILHNSVFPSSKTAGAKFGGADATGANLPKEDFFEGRLNTIEESSKIARKLYSILLLALAFSVITIASTNDPQLLTNSAASPLPIIQTQIPIGGFFLVAPVLVFGFFLYFHLQLLHQWKLIARLPAVFPDGSYLTEKIYPWLLNTWVRNFFKLIPKEDSLTRMARNISVVLLTWYSTPIILLAFWIRYLCIHDEAGTRWHILLILAAVIFSLFFHIRAKYILSRISLKPLSGITLHSAFGFLVLVLLTIAIGTVSNLALKGDLSKHRFDWISTENASNLDRLKLNWGHILKVDLQGKDLSIKPENWDPDLERIDPKSDDKEIFEKKYKSQLNRVQGVDLTNAHMEYAFAPKVFLANANLTASHLKGADLSGAHLENARLPFSNLQDIKLSGAHLAGANIQQANLKNANLMGADLKGVNLLSSDLEGANLFGVNLENSALLNANIKYAVFFKAQNLSAEQLKYTRNWDTALFDNLLRKKLNISDDHLRKLIPKVLKAQPLWGFYENNNLKILNTWYCEYELPECKEQKPKKKKASDPPSPLQERSNFMPPFDRLRVTPKEESPQPPLQGGALSCPIF